MSDYELEILKAKNLVAQLENQLQNAKGLALDEIAKLRGDIEIAKNRVNELVLEVSGSSAGIDSLFQAPTPEAPVIAKTDEARIRQKTLKSRSVATSAAPAHEDQVDLMDAMIGLPFFTGKKSAKIMAVSAAGLLFANKYRKSKKIHKRGHKVTSKRRLKKAKNKKYRWFVDNIIMHHKRLHDANRTLSVDQSKLKRVPAKHRAIDRTLNEKQRNLQKIKQDNKQKDPELKLQNMRQNIEARRVRAKTRWNSLGV